MYNVELGHQRSKNPAIVDLADVDRQIADIELVVVVAVEVKAKALASQVSRSLI